MAKKIGERFLVLNTDYGEFIDHFYCSHPELTHQPYDQQLKARMASLTGMADFYSKNLRKLGFEAFDVTYNHPYLQRQWAEDYLPFFHPLRRFKSDRKDWLDKVLEKQIGAYQPTIILNLAMESVDSRFFKNVKRRYPFIKLVIGQHAALLTPTMADLSGYDLLISSLPHYVERFRKKGLPAHYLPLAFESTILGHIRVPQRRKYPVTHIGSYGPIHEERNRLLERVAVQVLIDFWGQGTQNLAPDSPIMHNFHGPAWGLEMYRILTQSKITLTKHITQVAGKYANNMTLYEATGSGCMLLTDHKANLNKLFKVGKEIVAYRHPEDLVRKIRYYVAHDKAREQIARAGQRRTLKDHTYYHRAKSLVAIVEDHLKNHG